MRTVFLLSFVLAAASLCGCKSFEASRYYVSRVSIGSSALPSIDEDKAAAGEALDRVAAEMGFAPRNAPLADGRIFRYYSNGGANPIIIVGLADEHFVHVDVEHLHQGMRRSPELGRVITAVRQALQERFGSRLKQVGSR